MKIIDLLNRIVNGEEVPKKIKYRNKIFIYDKDNQCYVVENYNEYYDLHMSLSNHKGTDLNYEVEILEEKKIPEKLENYYDENLEEYVVETYIKGINYKEIFNSRYDEMIISKINEVLDYLKSKGE